MTDPRPVPRPAASPVPRPVRAAAAAGVLAALTLFAAPSSAGPAWVIEPARSSIHFDYTLDGRAVSGRFTRFEGGGRFSPDRPEEAALEIRIASDSIDLGNRLFSAYATSAEWFDAKNAPEVVFTLSELVPLGAGRYETVGDLSIRGVTHPARGEIALDLEGIGRAEGGARASGVLRVDRLDYDLGVGPSALVVDVGRKVAVRFRLSARPAAGYGTAD